jgi:hypothetical protein
MLLWQTQRRVDMRVRVVLLGLGLGIAAPVGADVVVIHNGLAPPDPANVVDAADDYADDQVYVQNVGCDATVQDPCPMPWGAPTHVELADGGSVQGFALFQSSILETTGGAVTGDLVAFDSSRLTMRGGQVTGRLFANDSAAVTVAGGSLGDVLAAYGAAEVTVRGGSVGYLRADDSSLIQVVGSGFAVEGVAVSEGPIHDTAGTLTGTLDSGDPIDAFFCHAGCSFSPQEQFTGLITLAPEPDAALLGAVAVLGLGLRRARPLAAARNGSR